MIETNSLVIFTEASKMLAEANTIQKAKELKDLALTAADWAKRKDMGEEAIQYARSYALDAERKMGELLRETDRNPGAKGNPGGQGASIVRLQDMTTQPTLAELGLTKRESSQAQKLAEMPEEQFIAVREGAKTRSQVMREQRRERIVTLDPLTLPVGKYRTIVIDPPWPMEKILREERPNQCDYDYPVMSIEEIKAFPIKDLAFDDGCHVYLWTTQKFLPVAFDVFKSWGVNYECLLTWVKNVGFTPFSWMYSTEHCLFGRSGSLPLLQMGKRLDFAAKVREHSRKPNEFYSLVAEVSPEPRIDIFSREKHEGFNQYGNETDRFAA